jgi:hypothetical protein
MVGICSKIFSKPERDVINKIRAHSLRRRRVQSFAITLADRFEDALFR